MSELRARQSFADITREDVHGKPWKYVGYKGYANLISLDNDFFILRRFGALNARVALLLQDKIVELEAQLKELDAWYSSKSAGDFDNGTFRGDLEDRSGLLDQIESALKRYSKFQRLTSYLISTKIYRRLRHSANKYTKAGARPSA